MAGKFAVIGLGLVGKHLVEELVERGAEVLAIDADPEKLDDVKSIATDVIRMDSTEDAPLRVQGLENFDAVIVTIGDNFEAMLLTVSLLQEIGVRRIIARATTPVHKRILNHLGITEVMQPAAEAAERLATSLTFEGVVNSFSVSEDYTIVELAAPDGMIGEQILTLDIRKRFNVSIITVKRIETKRSLLGLRRERIERITGIPQPDSRIERGDILVLFGRKEDITRMADAF
jgi:trk system potassium uptake protein TrkA